MNTWKKVSIVVLVLLCLWRYAFRHENPRVTEMSEYLLLNEIEFSIRLALMDREREDAETTFRKVALGDADAKQRNLINAEARIHLAPTVEAIGGKLPFMPKYDYDQFTKDYLYARSDYLAICIGKALDEKEAKLLNSRAYQSLSGHRGTSEVPQLALEDKLYGPLLEELNIAIKGGPSQSEEFK